MRNRVKVVIIKSASPHPSFTHLHPFVSIHGCNISPFPWEKVNLKMNAIFH
uniref:Uncharacterized protein n=1 Tax=Rhizophora mucronata TaxID=61149 RepID=A0A2P2PHC1_RHIMU